MVLKLFLNSKITEKSFFLKYLTSPICLSNSNINKTNKKSNIKNKNKKISKAPLGITNCVFIYNIIGIYKTIKEINSITKKIMYDTKDVPE